ncbi:MAG: hypothetical protein OER88_05855 [Planctomycetota bacterium]|nr:hypothetical protein [Planctomycetota bacterium]
MELNDALDQITEIRLRMARAEVFRGYKAAPTALSALLAVAAAGIQVALLPNPGVQPTTYVMLWIGAAALSGITAGATMWIYYRRSAAPLKAQTAWLAAEQLLPAMVGGALLTFVMVKFATDSLWLLPGIWQVLFSIGLFASCRQLPRAMVAIALFYLATGIACIVFARGVYAFSPWAMGAPFGVGQVAAAAILYWTLERVHE